MVIISKCSMAMMELRGTLHWQKNPGNVFSNEHEQPTLSDGFIGF